jgi:hypothetical protein
MEPRLTLHPNPAAKKYEGGPINQPEGARMSTAKALVAVAGSTVTAALGLIPPHTTLWTILTVAAAAITAAGVYLVPNLPTK